MLNFLLARLGSLFDVATDVLRGKEENVQFKLPAELNGDGDGASGGALPRGGRTAHRTRLNMPTRTT